jgi:signal peptidase I
MTGLRRLAAPFALTAIAAFALALGVTFVAARVMGYRWLTVLSGSMAPQMQVGDLIVDEPARARDVRAGEIVTFRDPEGGRRLITHRVRSVVDSGGEIEFVTKGDKNNATETWRIPADGELGRVVASVPLAGRLVGGLSGRTGRLGLLVAIVCWAAYEALGPLPFRRRRTSADLDCDPIPEETNPLQDPRTAQPSPMLDPVRVERRASASGVIVVCRQPIRLGRTYAGQTVAVHVTDSTATVELDGEARVVPRTTTLPVRNIKAKARRTPVGAAA